MDGKPVRNYENKLLAVLFFTVGFVFFDRLSIDFLFPFMRAEFALTNSQIGLLTSALALTWAISGIVLSSFAENLNKRKPILILAVIVFSACSIGSGLATTFIGLLVARAVMGLAEGPVLPISQTLMGFASSESRRGFNMGFVQASAGGLLGAVLAPMVVVPLAEHYGWRVAFFVAGIPGLIIAFCLFKMVVEPSRQSLDAQHAATGAAVAGDDKPGSLKHLLRNHNVLLCVLISCLFVTWFVALTTFAPLYLMEKRGFSATEMGMLMTVLGVSSVIGGFMVPGLSDRIGRRPTMIIFSAIAVTVPLVLVYVQVSLPVLALLLFLTYFGYGVFPIFLATIPRNRSGSPTPARPSASSSALARSSAASSHPCWKAMRRTAMARMLPPDRFGRHLARRAAVLRAQGDRTRQAAQKCCNPGIVETGSGNLIPTVLARQEQQSGHRTATTRLLAGCFASAFSPEIHIRNNNI